MNKKSIILLFILPITLLAKRSQDISATQIIDSSIYFCGGESKISKIRTCDLNYLLKQPDETKAIINEKNIVGQKFVQSILSKQNFPQTTFFNGNKIIRVNRNSISSDLKNSSKDEMLLKTYNQIQYGYKQLNFKFEKMQDQKFDYFDCFVIKATSKNGYSTLNFFDKKNYRLLMITYPNGNKSLLTNYIFRDSVLFNSEIINTFLNTEKTQTLKLTSIDLNTTINDMWFDCPYEDTVKIPDFIKIGQFESTNGAETKFTRTEKSMDYFDNKGNLILRRFIGWKFLSEDTYGLIDEKDLIQNNNDINSQILVKIVSWNKTGYVCQWITEKQTDTQDYKLVK